MPKKKEKESWNKEDTKVLVDRCILDSKEMAEKYPELTKEYCATIEGEFPVYSGQTENDGVMSSIDEFEFDAGEDVRGPITLAIAAQRSASSNLGNEQGGEGARDSRIVVFGDADFATNYLFDFQKNGDLFMNALSWLAEEEDLISIRARDPEDRRLSLTGTGSRLVLLFSVVLLPLASFIAAIAIYVKRK